MEDVIDFNPNERLEKGTIKKSVPMAALSTDSMIVDRSLFTQVNSNSGSKFRNGDVLFARITPCLENGKTAFVNFLDTNEIAVGSTEFITLRSKTINPYLVYCIARSEKFRNIAISSMMGADGRQRVQVDKIKSIPFLLPDCIVISLSTNFLEPLFDEVLIALNQCERLQQARDALLPKLMSGEIEFKHMQGGAP